MLLDVLQQCDLVDELEQVEANLGSYYCFALQEYDLEVLFYSHFLVVLKELLD